MDHMANDFGLHAIEMSPISWAAPKAVDIVHASLYKAVRDLGDLGMIESATAQSAQSVR